MIGAVDSRGNDNQRGHFDVEKYGSAYVFCAKPPN
jgi:hypothetical protein